MKAKTKTLSWGLVQSAVACCTLGFVAVAYLGTSVIGFGFWYSLYIMFCICLSLWLAMKFRTARKGYLVLYIFPVHVLVMYGIAVENGSTGFSPTLMDLYALVAFPFLILGLQIGAALELD